MSNPSDFVINNGVLVKYIGPGGDVVIPEGVTSIGEEAFRGCKSLTSAIIPNGVKRIDPSAFSFCSGLTEVMIPDSVAYIGHHAFSNCTGLVSLAIPNGVRSIENLTFAGCSNLTSVLIPNSVRNIGYSAFQSCRCLTEIIMPESITSVGSDAFKGCHGLKSATFPESITDVFLPVFNDCSCTVKIRRWSPSVATAIKDCNDIGICSQGMLSEIPAAYRRQALLGFASEEGTDYTSERAIAYLDYAQKNAGKLCEFAFDHPALLYYLCEQKLIKAKDAVAYMEEAEKRGNTEYKALLLNYQNELGDKVINKARAKKEKAKEEYMDALTERIVKRDPARGIEGMTFVVTGNLSSVWESRKDVQAYLESFGARLGSSVTKKTDYLVTNQTDSGSEKNKKAKEYGALVINEDEFNEIIGKRFRDAAQITVPGWLREIPQKAFSGCKSLESVVVSEGVESIGWGAFYYCNNLKDATLPESLKSIGGSAFEGCSSLTSLLIPRSVSIIGRDAFKGCKSLARVEIQNRETDIGKQAFKGCNGLADSQGLVIVEGILYDYVGPGGTVTVPQGVKKVGDYAFSYCKNLTEMILPPEVTVISDMAFYFCSSLTSVTIPESVASIGNAAFSGCKSLADADGFVIINGVLYGYYGPDDDITIPSSVTRIGNRAFEGCNSLTSVTIPTSVTSIGSGVFINCNNLKCVIIPESVTTIDEGVYYSTGFTIHAPAGSCAEEYARKFNIRFAAE